MDVGIGTFVERGFDQTVEAVRAALSAHGFGILHEVDLTSTLEEKAGKHIERVVILGACDPRFSAEAYEINKDVALMIPCNVVVREAGGGCVVEAQNPDLLPQVISGGLQDLADALSAQLRSMMKDLSH